MFNEKKGNNGFLLGLLTGGVIGSLAALLYAPKSGKELRQDIVTKKDELLEETDRIIDNAKTRASEIIAEGRKKAMMLIDEGRKKVESFTESGENMLTNGKEKIEETVSSVSETASKVKDAVRSGVDAYNNERKLSEEKSKSHKTQSKYN